MSYERCATHNLRNCIMCTKPPAVINVPQMSVINPGIPSGWSPEDALDNMPGPGGIQATHAPAAPQEMDQATKDAIARQAAMRKAQETGASDIVIPGVTDVAQEATYSTQDMIPRVGDPTPVPIAAQHGTLSVIDEKILQAGDRLAHNGAMMVYKMLNPETNESDPVISAKVNYNGACNRVKRAVDRLGEAKLELGQAEIEHTEALAERDLTREILQKAVADL
jgi:hypothetical protein